MSNYLGVWWTFHTLQVKTILLFFQNVLFSRLSLSELLMTTLVLMLSPQFWMHSWPLFGSPYTQQLLLLSLQNKYRVWPLLSSSPITTLAQPSRILPLNYFLNFYWSKMIYNVIFLLYSKENQLYIYMYTYIYVYMYLYLYLYIYISPPYF